MTKICFIDESGDLGRLSDPPLPNDQPVLVIGGLFIDETNIHPLTDDFLNLKQRFFRPHNPSPQRLNGIQHEIKGSTIRKHALRRTTRLKKHATGFLDGIFDLLQTYDTRSVARIWVKGIGKPFKDPSVYTSSIQAICTYFKGLYT